jgi:hypothetical protein
VGGHCKDANCKNQYEPLTGHCVVDPQPDTFVCGKSTCSVKKTGPIICSDSGAYSCPENTTCCQTKTGGYNCCPYLNGTCCDDNVHCCPNDHPVCNSKAGVCTKTDGTDPISWSATNKN